MQAVGYLADRMSLNLELPTAQGLQKLAPGKTREKILTPMRQIQNGIREQKLLLTDGGRIAKKPDNGSSLYLPGWADIVRKEQLQCQHKKWKAGAFCAGGTEYADDRWRNAGE